MLKLLENLNDFRRKQGQRYDLKSLLFVSVLGILSNADSYRKIEIFIKGRFTELKERFNLNWKRHPSYSTIRNAIQGVSSDELETIFREDALAKLENLKNDGETLEFSFDGKVVKGSFDNFKDVKAIQILSVFCNNYKLIMAHEEIADKTNEIPIAQSLIPSLQFKDAIFTCDALNCQTNTINKIIQSENEFVVQVKSNQKFLLDDILRTVEIKMPIETFKEIPEKAHGRITSRTTSVFDISNIRNLEQKWDGVNCIVEVQRDRKLFSTKEKVYKDSSEISYYISTAILTAEKFNSTIRAHWAIENSNYYVRDVALREDSSRIRVNPQNMVRLKSFAMNILRSNNVCSIARRLYENAVNIKMLFELNLE